MMPDALEVNQAYHGRMPDYGASLFEFSKQGPELRLFFARTPDEVVQHVNSDDGYLGLLRSGDLAVVPWKIGDALGGDAQFLVFLYPPETRPTPEILNDRLRYEVRIILT